ncbi:MAG TPA: hypothetical protein VIV08_02305 [Acidimicrobiia bacterium]
MLDVSFAIEAPSGWLELEDPANGYEAHKESRIDQSVTWRKQEISSNYVEGTYVNDAVRENVTETIAIYVDAPTPFVLMERVTALTDALSQIRYQVAMRSGDLLETWDCGVADYTIQTPQEMINARMAVVRAVIPRRPTVVMAQVT